MKVIAINGSPRRNYNTAKLCQAVLDGAASVGAETKLVHLETMKFKGCMSCYACHMKKNWDTNHCFYKDEISDLLEECKAADVLVIGSPIYYGFITGDVRAFMERLMFPLDTYVMTEDGKRPVKIKKKVATAMIYTMNANEHQISKGKQSLDMNTRELKRIFGYSIDYYAYDTCQWNNYEPYASNLFDAKHKYEQGKVQFPKDIENCYQMGINLVKKAGELNVE